VVRANKGFFEGVHYWEIICPISLSTLRKYSRQEDLVTLGSRESFWLFGNNDALLPMEHLHGMVRSPIATS